MNKTRNTPALDLSPHAAAQLLQQAPIGTLLVSAEGGIVWFNDTLTQLLGLEYDQLAGRSTAQLSAELCSLVIDPPDSLLLQRGGEQLWIRTYRQDNNDGTKFRYYLDATQEHQMRCERDQLVDELRQLNTRDPITGLPNQRALLQALEPLVSRSRRYGNPLSIIKLDIVVGAGKGLDALNNRATWQQVGHRLKFQMRWADIIGRWNDGQFLFILPETPEISARQLADKICALVTDMALQDDNHQPIALRPHCSVVAWEKGDDAKRLLNRADEQLQTAKQAGQPVV